MVRFTNLLVQENITCFFLVSFLGRAVMQSIHGINVRQNGAAWSVQALEIRIVFMGFPSLTVVKLFILN